MEHLEKIQTATFFWSNGCYRAIYFIYSCWMQSWAAPKWFVVFGQHPEEAFSSAPLHAAVSRESQAPGPLVCFWLQGSLVLLHKTICVATWDSNSGELIENYRAHGRWPRLLNPRWLTAEILCAQWAPRCGRLIQNADLSALCYSLAWTPVRKLAVFPDMLTICLWSRFPLILDDV